MRMGGSLDFGRHSAFLTFFFLASHELLARASDPPLSGLKNSPIKGHTRAFRIARG